ncbi:HAMP domain-containing protein [Bdellovibrio bacteriovorus]|uniref:HAMP domain-containing protein n=1 Tax=Bdellovibrio bacteriovorus TaxID=959 RepID=UPI0021D39A9B|nr:HAMP domain-containing protein [Bdellovibrio bacteriovorus]UXR63663.1 HAMP domain-containing protein [Bdellovibrio bacteriovorus]
MNKKALIKISLFSLTIALALSAVSLLFMHRFMSIQGARFRDDFLRFYAQSLEQRLQGLSLDEIKKQKDILRRDRDFRPPMPPPGAMMGPPPMPRPPHEEPRHRDFPKGPPPDGFRPPPPMDFETWIVDENGEILIAKRIPALPIPWNQLPHPKVSKQVVSVENFFRLGTVYMILKLDTESPTYLVVKEPPRPILGGLILTQALLTASMIVIALILAMASLFFYMRKKSVEARSVLRRLEEGDLKARFEIHRLDEFGELMLDFNRMAEEIEKLVSRIHATERTRNDCHCLDSGDGVFVLLYAQKVRRSTLCPASLGRRRPKGPL